MRSAFTAGVLSIAFVGSVGAASAATYGFGCISNNNANDCSIAESQMFMDVTESGSDVLFTFRNIGPEDSSITNIYWDFAGSLLSFVSIDNSDDGVSFSEGGAPANLPDGSTLTPAFSADFSVSPVAPTQPNGVNPGEVLGVLFEGMYADVLGALASADLRVGIRIQGYDSGGSEALVNDPNVVPLPAAGWLLLAGLGGLAAYGRKKRWA